MALEANFGIQINTQLTNSTKIAYMRGGNVIAKYKFNNRKAIFGRCEFYQDSNDILTCPVFNETHQLVGLNAAGLSIGGGNKTYRKFLFSF